MWKTSLVKTHRLVQVCKDCGQSWPCDSERESVERRRQLAEAAEAFVETLRRRRER
jgi:hypothetical protein